MRTQAIANETAKKTIHTYSIRIESKNEKMDLANTSDMSNGQHISEFESKRINFEMNLV